MKLRYAAAVPATAIIILISLFTACATNGGLSPGQKEPSEPGTASVERPTEDPYAGIVKSVNEGDSKSAVEQFKKVRDDSPGNIIAYAGLLMSAGDYRAAEDELNGLLESDPLNADALFTLALVKGMQADISSETELLEKAIAADDKHSQALAVRGMLYLSDSKLNKASEMFRRSLDSDPDNIMALTGYGSTLIRQEKYKEAEGYLDRAVELDPENPFTYLDRSSARSANGNPGGAESDLSAAIELEPDYFWHYLDRGRLRIRELGDRDGALADFNRAIELKPEIFYPYVFRAGIYDEMGDYEAAARDYRLVIEKKPDYYFAYSSLGIDEFLLEDWDGCRNSFEKAFQFEPKEYSYLAMAAVAEMKKGDDRAAQQYYAKIMDKIPATSIYYHILRSFRERNYDAYALRLIQEQDDEGLKKRLLFYIAELYHESGMGNAAYSYFTVVRDAKNLGYFESRLAEHELENHYE